MVFVVDDFLFVCFVLLGGEAVLNFVCLLFVCSFVCARACVRACVCVCMRVDTFRGSAFVSVTLIVAGDR